MHNEARRLGGGVERRKSRCDPVWQLSAGQMSVDGSTYSRAKSLLEQNSVCGQIGWSSLRKVAEQLGLCNTSKADAGLRALFEKVDIHHTEMLDPQMALRILYPDVSPQALARAARVRRLTRGASFMMTDLPTRHRPSWTTMYDPQSLEEMKSLFEFCLKQDVPGVRQAPPAAPVKPLKSPKRAGVIEPLNPRTRSSILQVLSRLSVPGSDSAEHRLSRAIRRKRSIAPLGFLPKSPKTPISKLSDNSIPRTPTSVVFSFSTSEVPEMVEEPAPEGITKSQLRACISTHAIPDDWIDEIFEQHALTCGDRLTLEEFAAVMHDSYKHQVETKNSEVQLFFQGPVPAFREGG